jgi:hypothetical protein
MLTASFASAEVVRVEVATKQDVLGGRAFGAAGAYEWIQGTAYFTLDPKQARNDIVVDLALAPRNAAGLVEFSADIVIVHPKDPARASGAVVFDVVNRGRPQIFSFLHHGTLPARADAEAFFGDGFLMKQGATIVWLGWQQDAAPSPNLLRMTGPRVQGVTGVVNGEFVVPKRVGEVPLGDRGAIPYVVADVNAAENSLRAASARGEPPTVIPRNRWRFDATHLYLEGGFDPGAVYEYTYLSKDPWVSGLGLAGVREIISWIRFDPSALVHATRAYAFGISQSGRFLRQFVHDGFNADVKAGRPVFDGMMIHIAGGSSRGFNGRFSQASLSPPSRVFPFTDLEQADAQTGEREGLLSRSASANVVPKILYTSSAWEYWGAVASNIHTTIDGKADMRLPETSRVYLMAGTQHVPVAYPPRFDEVEPGQLRENPLNYRPVLRALFVALEAWVQSGVAPPPSEIPTVKAGTLLPTTRLDMRAFKAINTPPGPKIFSRPNGGKAYASLVAKVDADGNEVAGVRVPEQLVPLATYTGWNLRSPAIGAPTDLVQSTGSYYPLARTRAERERAGDPRPSIAERYRSMDDYLARIEAAARTLVSRRLLLPDDVAFVKAAAETHWKGITATPTSSSSR